MNLSWIRIFVAVVEEGGFAAAARRNQISPAAVSKQVAALEEEVGVPLLRRSTRAVALTEPGRLFYEQSQRILEEVNEARALAMQMRAEPAGLLRVFSGRHFARRYIIPALSDYVSKYPLVDLDLHLVERMPNMERERVDILLGMSVSAAGDVIQRCILRTRYVFCAAPAYLETEGPIERPADLRQHRFITHSMRQPNDVLEFQGGQELSLKPFLRVNDTETMRTLALEGLGVIKVHEYVVSQDLADGRLVECLEGYTKEELPIWLAYRQQRHVPPKLRSFIDFILTRTHGSR
jgi:DNA-binding transcriptional LysR family regulator